MKEQNIEININCLTYKQLEQLKEMIFDTFKAGGEDDWAAKIAKCNDRQYELEN